MVALFTTSKPYAHTHTHSHKTVPLLVVVVHFANFVSCEIKFLDNSNKSESVEKGETYTQKMESILMSPNAKGFFCC